MDVASIKGDIVSPGTLWSIEPDAISKTTTLKCIF